MLQLRDCNDEMKMKQILDSDEYEFRFNCGVAVLYHMKLDQQE